MTVALTHSTGWMLLMLLLMLLLLLLLLLLHRYLLVGLALLVHANLHRVVDDLTPELPHRVHRSVHSTPLHSTPV
eukprot:COSAG05_NODE_2426_length_3077_cov_4.195769_2_plen_75_part_00